ncbi:MAG: hypothetical protein QOI58_3312 [Thermoanaerobaculia bacterium]|jgi:hypothetical protein|nr:hypothetical protein [Thermoanaerobaculia bacterium]
MTVWLRRCSSFAEEAEADREYWSAFAPDERVALISDLRQEWNTMNGANEPPSRDFRDFLQLLGQHDVKALIIGAFAVAFHAKPRFTKDLDIFVEATADNGERLLRAIDAFGFGTLGLTVDDFAPGRVTQLGFPPNRIDLVTSIDGVTFEEAWASRVAGKYADIDVWYIGRETLVRNKAAAARPQDLMDLATLR